MTSKGTQLKARNASGMFCLIFSLSLCASSGSYYKEELTQTNRPKEEDTFIVEKILAKKRQNGKSLYLTKFLFYPQCVKWKQNAKCK
jgi:hypothetical protein